MTAALAPVPVTIVRIEVAPKRDTVHYDATVLLDKRQWHFSFYTDDEGYWSFDLAVTPGVPILAGIGLTVGLDLLFQYRHLDVPPGSLFVVDKDNRKTDPNGTEFFDDLYDLVYLEGYQA